MTCNSETCHCFLFAGEIYQDQSGIQDMIDQDDFATRDVFQDDSDGVKIIADKLLEDENSAKSSRKRGVWLSELFQGNNFRCKCLRTNCWKMRIPQRAKGEGVFGYRKTKSY